MEWVERLYGKTVGIDTAPFIYFIEEHSSYIKMLRPFFEAMEDRKFKAVTSTITLIETLVIPIKRNNKSLAKEYKDILLNSNLNMIEISMEVAEMAANLRATSRIRTPDAIQLAATLNSNASHFITNDLRLPKDIPLQIIDIKNLI